MKIQFKRLLTGGARLVCRPIMTSGQRKTFWSLACSVCTVWDHSLQLFGMQTDQTNRPEKRVVPHCPGQTVSAFCVAASCMQHWRPAPTAGQGLDSPGVCGEHRDEGREGPGSQDLRADVLPRGREVEEGRRSRVLPVRLSLREQLDERPQPTGLHYLRLRASQALQPVRNLKKLAEQLEAQRRMEILNILN